MVSNLLKFFSANLFLDLDVSPMKPTTIYQSFALKSNVHAPFVKVLSSQTFVAI